MIVFKVSINQESISKVEKNVRDAFNKVIRNKELMNELGSTIVTDIEGVNRSGKSPRTGNIHPHLEKSTIRNREYLELNNVMHKTFKPERSNVTTTGELIDSLDHKIDGPGQLSIKATGIHKQYKGKNNQNLGKKIENELIVKYLKDKGFYIMGIREKLLPRLRRTVIAYIRRASRVLFRLENEQ